MKYYFFIILLIVLNYIIMSVYVKCPSCGAILADKELKFIEFKEKIDEKNLPE